MHAFRVLVSRIRCAFGFGGADGQLDEEVRAHLELLTAEYERQGMPLSDARLAARRAFGGVEQMKEAYRNRRGVMWLDDLLSDGRYAARSLRRNPGFTAVAVVTIALGIGANTAIFSVIEALLLRSLPVRNPEQLVQLARVEDGRPPCFAFSYDAIRSLAAHRELFTGLFGFTATAFSVGEPGSSERVDGAWVTGEYYDTLGIPPSAGRLLRADDDRRGAAPVAVISNGYWKRRFSNDPRIVGRTMLIDGAPVTIVGVGPSGFSGTTVARAADVTLPLGILPQVRPDLAAMLLPNSTTLSILARRASNAPAAQFDARLTAVWREIVEDTMPNASPSRDRALTGSVEAIPGGTGWSTLRNRFRRPLLVLMALVGLVLLIACMNVANLLLARTTARRRELATRLSLGAGRLRLIRQLLTESVVLSLGGAALGVVLAWWGSRTLVGVIARGSVSPISLDVTPRTDVLLFTTALAVATGMLFGLAPAWRGSLPASGNGSLRPVSPRNRTGLALVAAQVALSLLLLVTAGLFVRTLHNLRALDPGFRHEGVLLFGVSAARGGRPPDAARGLYEELRQALEIAPGIRAVSFSATTPLSGMSISFGVDLNGRSLGAEDHFFNVVGPRYFEAMGTPFRAGRDFTVRDVTTALPVAIVNEAFVRRYLNGVDPLGQRLSLRRPPSRDMQIVGVVADTVYLTLRAQPPPTVFIPFAQSPFPFGATFEVAVSGSLADAASAIRRELALRLPGALVDIKALTEEVERALAQERLMALLAGAFGMVALVLAAVGLYGLLAYTVTRRTTEIGVRTALGAEPSDVIVLVMRDALTMIAAGIAVGLPLAWAVSGVVRSMLFGLSANDASTMLLAVVVLVLASLVAAYTPARRAARVDPLIALRHE